MTTEKELNNDGGNAYPFTFENKSNHVVIIDGYELPAGHAIVNTGMTLRDYFAAHSPVTIGDAIVASGFDVLSIGVLSDSQRKIVFAELAFLRGAYSDAMLAERAK